MTDDKVALFDVLLDGFDTFFAFSGSIPYLVKCRFQMVLCFLRVFYNIDDKLYRVAVLLNNLMHLAHFPLGLVESLDEKVAAVLEVRVEVG